MQPQITFEDFLKVDIRVGKILEVSEFPEARKPAYKLKIDFGAEIGVKRTSAQLTVRYTDANALVGRKVIAVVNFPPKQVANVMSEVLVLGVSDQSGGIILLEPENQDEAPLGSRVH
ncbi:MAG TPA: tRNA-binding protein [Nitrososphaerales archaeon]|nr:tRNA-binding protein [Nitrososphaerales archaeon]